MGDYMENDNQKMDAALEFALQTPDDVQTGTSNAGYDSEEDRWRVIVKYYGNISDILSGINGVKFTELFNNYAVVSVPASAIDALATAQGIIYIEKPREVYFNVNNGREASCINSVQGTIDSGASIGTGMPELTGKGVLTGIIDSGERVIVLSS